MQLVQIAKSRCHQVEVDGFSIDISTLFGIIMGNVEHMTYRTIKSSI